MNWKFTKIYLIFFMSILSVLSIVENRLHIKVTGINCTSIDDNYVSFETCKIKAINRDTSEISVLARLKKGTLDNITLSASLSKRGFIRNKPLLQYTIDVCAFFRNKRRNPMAELFYTIGGFADYSNMNHSCPYEEYLLMNKYRFNASWSNLIPVPAGMYLFNTLWSTYNILRATVELKVNCFEKD